MRIGNAVAWDDQENGERTNKRRTQEEDRSMQRHATSSQIFPSFMIPCPYCGGRMIVTSVVEAADNPDCEDITHSCLGCGSELTRAVGMADRPARHAERA